jgi:hypothetical protein
MTFIPRSSQSMIRLVLAGVAVTSLGAVPASAAPAIPVNVTNTSVPTTIQGTASIQGSVSVTSLPAITLSPAGVVTVDGAILVHAIEGVPAFPIHARVTLQAIGSKIVYTVPTGCGLVLERVTGYVLDEAVAFQLAFIGDAVEDRREILPLTAIGGLGNLGFTMNHTTRQYYTPGEKVTCGLFAPASGNATGECTISGFLAPFRGQTCTP